MTTNPSRQRPLQVVLAISIVVASLGTMLAVGIRADTAPAVAAHPPAPVRQIIRPWTAVGSTAVMDETSLGSFAFTGPFLTFLAGSPASTIKGRFNVTNTYDNNANPNIPGWTTLELGSFAPATTVVTAKLVQVDNCTGVIVTLCQTSNQALGNVCTTCSFAPTPVDFTNNLYYVEVDVTRPAGSNALPRLNNVRVF